MNPPRTLSCLLLGFVGAGPALAQTAAPASPRPAADVLEHLADWLEHLIFPNGGDSQFVHWITCAAIFLAAILLRRVITHVIFHGLKKLASRTATTLDDKLFPALESPVATLVMVLGIFASLTVLRLSPGVDRIIGYGFNVALIGVIFWGLLSAGGAVLDHLEELAHGRQLAVATFMPLIKKTLATLLVVVGLLTVAQSFGADVKAFLAGLGIGGLAFALAAQDTIANLFGSFVVVVDQPFKVGETVTIGAHTGTVEDIGLRSTKIRKVDKSLVVIPNRSVANEAVVNLSRFTGRRVEQVLGLAYDARAAQLEGIVEDIRHILREQPELDHSATHVYFRDYSASSLDIWMAYVVKDPDFARHLAIRQRLNLAFMHAIEARGLSFAFPTQTVHVASLPAGQPGPKT
jgi:MscS family membrane protein